MSTCNFSHDNILVVIPDYNIYTEEENGEDIECLGWDNIGYNDYVSDVQKQLSKIGYTDSDKWDGNRNYEGKIIATYNLYTKDDYLYNSIDIVIRNGYYEAQNIDYIITDERDYDVKDSKMLDKKLASIVEKTIKILKKNGTEYYKAWQASNGEAGYNKVK